jgi:hypothetical protein
MSKLIQIQAVDCDGDDGLIVNFSDGTTAGYVAEELLQLRPCREQIEKPEDSSRDIARFPGNLPQIEMPGIA